MAKNKNFGPLIRNSRIALGLTQQEAAKKADISQSTFSKLENGDYALFPAIARRICKVLPLQYVPATLIPRKDKTDEAA